MTVAGRGDRPIDELAPSRVQATKRFKKRHHPSNVRTESARRGRVAVSKERKQSSQCGRGARFGAFAGHATIGIQGGGEGHAIVDGHLHEGRLPVAPATG